MILRRVTHHMKAQNWAAITVEFVLVVLGVFLGVAAANWNEQRLEKRETERLLQQVDDQLTANLRYIDALSSYYGITGAYGDRAIAAWQGNPSVSDQEFVIAAYQASQITAYGNNANVFGAIFGAENLRDIDDPEIRQSLAIVMTYDYALVDLRAVSTRYREEVRKTIPHSIQQAIRERCGDRQTVNGFALPTSCDVNLPPVEAARTAADLRARPELLGELHWHRAAVANQIANAAVLASFIRPLTERIGDPADSTDQQ
ncbi:MAG: hypothetical protein ACR2JJ_00460 [Sphingomicrobium sp.]